MSQIWEKEVRTKSLMFDVSLFGTAAAVACGLVHTHGYSIHQFLFFMYYCTEMVVYLHTASSLQTSQLHSVCHNNLCRLVVASVPSRTCICAVILGRPPQLHTAQIWSSEMSTLSTSRVTFCHTFFIDGRVIFKGRPSFGV